MSDFLVPLGFFLSTVVMVVGVAQIVATSRVRRQLIEARVSPEEAAALVRATRGSPDARGALMWALVIGCVGAAMILIDLLPVAPDEPTAAGVILVAAAAGLLAYFATARRLAAR